VENLTEVALQKIHGNVLLGRAAALYHDIGKLKNPQYFIENQLSGENPHDKLEPMESAQILINHVVYGQELAKKHNLPQQLCNMIYSHHANSQTIFFVKKQKDLHPNEPVDLSKFTYPKLHMKDKELAILMIADVTEAAVRSLKVYTKEKIEEVVSRIIDEMIETKRLKNFDITLREIEKVRVVLVETLINVYHSRIAYPPQDKAATSNA
jgi:putative nucleotidyltransferase with HDIG domain